jgi:short subunit dehydrogenase-like uncharacterized protein
MPDRDFDIVLQGSTGFTGRLTAAELARHAPAGLRWAVAGRDAVKVEALAQEFAVPALVADGLDEAAIDRLVASTRVVLSCAGPYARYGTPLITACARHGTHYADLTGEVPWVAHAIRELHGTAETSGATLIPASGFDSVPSDLGVQALAERCPGVTRIHGFYRMRGGLNGGTLATALDLAASEHRDAPPPSGAARTFAIPTLGSWGAPFALAPMNVATVRRTAELRQAPLQYSEHLLTRGRLGAWAGSVGLATVEAMLRGRFGRAVLRRLGPKPGEGPSEKARRDGWVEFTALAGPLDAPECVLRWHWPGDPANTVTTRCLAQVGMALAAGEAQAAGVQTPAAAFGTALRERLHAIGAYSDVAPPTRKSE